MWKQLYFRLVSDCPMIQHSGRTANPLDPFAKALKEISGKRKKSDSDYEQMARIEFASALYLGPDGPVIPAPNIDAALLAAAKKLREGPLAKSALFCSGDASMEFSGPRNVDGLWADERFRHTAIVRVQNARVVRTRPIFREWAATVTVQYEDSLINAGQVDAWFQIAGTQCGLGDWRPQHGRFSATRVIDK